MNSPKAGAQYTAPVYNRSTRFALPISDRSRLIPELEMTRRITKSPRRDCGEGLHKTAAAADQNL